MLIEAAKANEGVRGVGYEINSELHGTAMKNVAAAGLKQRIRILQTDAREADLGGAAAVTMYLSERGNTEMMPAILRGAASREAAGLPPPRVVTFSFEVAGLEPAATAMVDGIPVRLYDVSRATKQT